MDPISIAASVVAFIQLADQVISTCKTYIDGIKDAPKEMHMIMGEITSLKAIMESLNVVELHSTTAQLMPNLFEKTGPVEACRRCLGDLERLLPLTPPQQEGLQGKRRITMVELTWPLKESKVRRLLAEIAQHKSTLLLVMTGDIIHDIKNIRRGVDKLDDALTDVQRQTIFSWLETTNPSSLHNAALKKHERHTCAWLLRSPEWLSWITQEEPNRFLWIHGIPGCGKTVLASFINDRLRQLCSDNPGLAHAYYYCHYSHDQDETVPFLRWIIGKLCRQARWIPQQLKSIHDLGDDPTIAELENVLESLTSRFKTIYLTVDAVDESSPRTDLLALIATIVLDKRFQNIRVLCTSRPEADIERLFSGISIPISMSNPLVKQDIREFVRHELASRDSMRRWAPLFGEIEDILVHGARGMFRWADCQLQAIHGIRDELELRMVLRNLPESLTETYVRILDKIPSKDQPFVFRALLWVAGHTRAPWLTGRGINVDLLISAVCFDLGLPEGTRHTRVYDYDYLREACGCLLTYSHLNPGKSDEDDSRGYASDSEYGMRSDSVAAGKTRHGNPKREAATYVSMAHYTVIEFLESPYIHQTRVSHFALDYQMNDVEFTESVLRQALAARPSKTSIDWINDREAYCLILACAQYRHTYWGNDVLESLYIQYLDPTEPHYQRLRGIQEAIGRGSNLSAKSYFMMHLPFYIRGISQTETRAREAATLLNILLVAGRGLANKFITSKNRDELFGTRLLASWYSTNVSGLLVAPSVKADVESLEGTIWEIIEQRRYIPSGIRY